MNLILTMVCRRNVEGCKQSLMGFLGGSVEVQDADCSEMTHRIEGILSLISRPWDGYFPPPMISIGVKRQRKKMEQEMFVKEREWGIRSWNKSQAWGCMSVPVGAEDQFILRRIVPVFQACLKNKQMPK